MIWIDYFLYNGEPIVELRLEYLYRHVDKFYIVEGQYTHQGTKKDILYFEKNKDIFKPYLDKIIFIENDYYDNNMNSFERENHHRNFVAPYILNNETSPFILSVCDADEIPDVNIMPTRYELYYMCNNSHIKMHQLCFFYNLTWLFNNTWISPYFINDNILKKNQNLTMFRNTYTENYIKCGWHITYFMSIKDIKRKIQSFCHNEVNEHKYYNEEHIYNCIKDGKQLFLEHPHHDKTPLTKVVDIEFPTIFYKYNNKIMSQQTI